MAKKYQLTPTIKKLLVDISLKKDTYQVLEELQQYFIANNFQTHEFKQLDYFNRIVYKQILLFSDNLNKEINYAKCTFLFNVSISHFKKENYHNAIRTLHKISSFFNKSDLNQYWSELQIRQLINLGGIYRHTDDLYSSIYYLTKSEQLVLQNREIINPLKYLFNIYNNLGISYFRVDINKTLFFHTKSNDLAKKLNLTLQECITLLNLAYSYHQLLKIELAKTFLQEAMLLAEKNGYEKLKVKIYSLYALIELSDNNLTKAKGYLELSYPLTKSLNLKDLWVNYFLGLGEFYFAQKKYKKAITYFTKSLKLLNNLKNEIQSIATLERLSSAYHLLGDYKKAYEILAQKNELQEKYYGMDKLNMLRGLEEQQKELELQEKELAVQQKVIKLENTALLTQMNPHFIFNSLNTLQELVLRKNDAETLKYIADFSALLRELLQLSKKQIISLEQELSFLKRYVTIEETRFTQQFNFEIKIAAEIPTHLISIPVMILQPIVENAIQHGLAPMKGKQLLKISIHLEISNDFLYLRIIDNGIGFNKGKKNNVASESIALNNIKERIELLKTNNGEKGKIEIGAGTSTGKKGTCVNLWIPLQFIQK